METRFFCCLMIYRGTCRSQHIICLPSLVVWLTCTFEYNQIQGSQNNSFSHCLQTTHKNEICSWERIFVNCKSVFFYYCFIVNLQLGWCITAAYVFVILFGAFGNMLTVIAVIYNPQMRTTRNFFILNLALSDFFVCTITAPVTLYTVSIFIKICCKAFLMQTAVVQLLLQKSCQLKTLQKLSYCSIFSWQFQIV